MTAPEPTVSAKKIRIFKDPMSAWTHFVALWASLAGTILLMFSSSHSGPKFISMTVYGFSLVAVFFASSIYHFFDLGERGNRWLRRLDHAAIFLLVGGTYVPILLHYFDGDFRAFMLTLVAVMAAIGIIFKVAWIDCPDWLGASIYLVMVAVLVIPTQRVFPLLAPQDLMLLLFGGAAYILGAGVFVFQWPDPWPERFGHHEVWHIFVILGAGAHYFFTLHMLPSPIPGG